jgi:hypothetical protein
MLKQLIIKDEYNRSNRIQLRLTAVYFKLQLCYL